MKKETLIVLFAAIFLSNYLVSEKTTSHKKESESAQAPTGMVKKAITTLKAEAAFETVQLLHPRAPKTNAELVRSIESKEEKKIAEHVAKNDFDSKTWLIIKSLRPGQLTANVPGISGKKYTIKVNRDRSLDITLSKK